MPSRGGIRVYSPCGTRGQATALRVLTKGARSHDLSTSRSVHTHSRGPQSDRLLDGSFVSAKALPADYDAAWETAGVDPDRLDPVLLDFDNRRAAMKAKYLGDLFPASAFAAPGVVYRDFFGTDRNGVDKGVVLIDLGSLP